MLVIKFGERIQSTLSLKGKKFTINKGAENTKIIVNHYKSNETYFYHKKLIA